MIFFLRVLISVIVFFSLSGHIKAFSQERCEETLSLLLEEEEAAPDFNKSIKKPFLTEEKRGALTFSNGIKESPLTKDMQEFFLAEERDRAVFLQRIRDLKWLAPNIIPILEKAGIHYLGDLVSISEKEFSLLPQIGPLTKRIVKKALKEKNLHFGMDIGWPSDSKQVESFVKIQIPKVELNSIFFRPIESLNFPTQQEKALKRGGIYYIGDLAVKKDIELLNLESFGKGGLQMVDWRLEPLGLSLRMNIDWPADPKQVKPLMEALKINKEEAPLLLAHPINICGFPLEITNVLRKNGIYYLGDLTTKREEELLALSGFKQGFLSEIESLLSEMDLSLRMNVDWPADSKQAKALADKLNPKVETTTAFARPIEVLKLSGNIEDSLKNRGIEYIGDLVTITEWEIFRKIPGLGKRKVSKIKLALEKQGWRFGMNLYWPANPDLKESLIDKLNNEKNLANPFFNEPIAVLGLSKWSEAYLTRAGITTVGQLTSKTPEELLTNIFGFGVNRLAEVERALHKKGWSLEQ